MTQKTILFDLDGTLTDSGEGIMNCAALALEHFHIPVPSREEMRVFVGPPLASTFRSFGIPEEKIPEAVKVFRSRYTPVGIFENTPYPGIRNLLETLNRQGHKLFVATSKPEEMAITVLRHFDLEKFFTGICGATMDESRTNKEEVIAYLLEKNGTADNMLMIGDTVFDVLGAASHGIPTIGVSWGYGDPEEMRKAGAKAVVSNMEELLNLIEKE